MSKDELRDHSQLGHLYVIDGDMQKLAVDAWLLPTDPNFHITPAWRYTINNLAPGLLEQVKQDGWKGDQFVLLNSDSGVDVWLGDIGRINGTSPTHYVESAREFIRTATDHVRSRDTADSALPVIAIPHIGTGHGGGASKYGQILQKLIASLTDDLNSGRIQADIVLVAWGEQAESAAQYFRSKYSTNLSHNPQWDFGYRTQELHKIAGELADHLRTNRLATFLGAGTSIGAGLLGWKDLLGNVAAVNDLGLSVQDLNQLEDLRDQATLIDSRLKAKGKNIKDALAVQFTKAKYSLQHGLISSLPCNEFITTNVDELFEIACRTNNRALTVLPNEEGQGERWLLKLHGSVSRPKSLVFTREDYHDSRRDSRALQGLVQAMLFTRHMLFVGYGLKDEDFHEIVYDVRRAIEDGSSQTSGKGTVILLRDEPLKAEMWSSMLRIVPVGTSLDDRQNARDVARFLDLIGMLAADKYRFLLDERYNHELFEEDDEIANKLRELARLKHSHDSIVWNEVEQLLERLGYNIAAARYED